MSGVTADDVLELTHATEGFLCPLSANTYGLTFESFVMKDYHTKEVIFKIGDGAPLPDFDISAGEDALRKIRYDFSVDVLKKGTISTLLVFSNGPEPLENFRMIERHYFRGRLIKSYDFKFGFVIPGTTNTWESVYALPDLEEDLIAEIVAHPYEVKSDSFYFSGDTLIMHNKAEYRYFDREGSAVASMPPTKNFSAGKTEEEEDVSDSKLDDEPHAKLAAEAEDDDDVAEYKARRSRARAGSSKDDD